MTNTTTNTLTLFSVRVDPEYSEYGCLFIIAAHDEHDARTVIEDHGWVGDFAFSDEHTTILNIGTANDTIDRGIVSEFTT